MALEYTDEQQMVICEPQYFLPSFHCNLLCFSI